MKNYPYYQRGEQYIGSLIRRYCAYYNKLMFNRFKTEK